MTTITSTALDTEADIAARMRPVVRTVAIVGFLVAFVLVAAAAFGVPAPAEAAQIVMVP